MYNTRQKKEYNSSSNYKSENEELKIYRNLLIELHTARWCMDIKRVTKILDAISAYSYARTNSNGDVVQDECNQARTLKKLGEI